MIAVLLALSLFGAACSDASTPQESAQGDATRPERKKNKSEKTGKGAADKKGSSPEAPASDSHDDGAGGSDHHAGDGSEGAPPPPAPGGAAAPSGRGLASQGPPSPVDPSLASRSSFVEDPIGDAKKEGALVPDYAELVRSGVQGLGEDFEMQLTFNGDVPQEMPDKNTIMVIGFGISAGGNDTYGFTAQGSQEGWKAYAGAKDGARRFPGQFLIEGDTITMRVPWKSIDGPREFKWQVNTTWFRSVASTTHYSFDQCPNGNAAKFPG